jgi:hypothetical protein
MMLALQILAVLLVAIAMALALAHALELPGKLRLSKDDYLAVQKIYYPGFTIGGMAEPLALVVVLALMLLTPQRAAFWLTTGALAALVLMHAAYWLVTHPVNNFWLKDVRLTSAGAGFFAFNPQRWSGRQPDWTELRDRWEFSHVARAGFGFVSLILLVSAVAV